MPSAGNVILASILPIVQVVLICLAGAAAVWKGVLTPDGERSLSRLIYYIFLPALIVTSLGSSATGSQILSWWFLVANIAINVLLGLGLGAAMLRPLAVPRYMWGPFLACACVGNLGNFPLLLIDAIPRHADRFAADAGERGTTYVLCSLFAICLAAFALGGHVLGKGKSAARDVTATELQEAPAQQPAADRWPSSALLEAQTPGRRAGDAAAAGAPMQPPEQNASTKQREVATDEPLRRQAVTARLSNPTCSVCVAAEIEVARAPHSAACNTCHAAQAQTEIASSSVDDAAIELQVVTASHSSDSSRHSGVGHGTGLARDELSTSGTVAPVEVNSATPQSARRSWRRRAKRFVRGVDGALLNAPTIAVLIGIFIAVVPPVNNVFFGDEENDDDDDKPPLDVFTQAGTRLGAAMIPSLMITLGASLAKGPGAHVPWRTVAGLAVLRLALLPVLGTLCVLGLRWWGAFEPPDDIFMLVLLLQQAMPSALNMFTLAVVNDSCPGEIATLLFWQYLASVVTIPACVAVFLVIL